MSARRERRPRTRRHPSQGADMRVVVDFDLCESNAICMGIAPEIFEVRDDDFLYVLDETPPESLRAEGRRSGAALPQAGHLDRRGVTEPAPRRIGEAVRTPMMGSVVIVGASLAGMHAAHTLRRQGFDGRITRRRRRPQPALRPAAAVQAGAGRQLGAGPDRAAGGQRGSRPRPAAGPAGHGRRPGRPLRAPGWRRAGGLRRPGHRRRRGGAAAAGHRGAGRRARAAHPRRLPHACGRELDGGPEPGGGRGRRVHRRRGGRHLSRARAWRSRCWRRPTCPSSGRWAPRSVR